MSESEQPPKAQQETLLQETVSPENVTADSPAESIPEESLVVEDEEFADTEEVIDAYHAQQALEPEAPEPIEGSVDVVEEVSDHHESEEIANSSLSLEHDEDPLDITIANKRVLLIEDDEDTSKILKQNLRSLGISKINIVSNAEGALNLLATDREMFPDIVILELALVGMDGIQFLAQLRAHKSKRLQVLPAVVITMLDSPSIFRRAARQKVGAFLRKPVSTQSLRDGIEAALRGDVVEQPFSQPKSWLDDVDEQELKEKRNSIKAKAAAKAEKKGFWVWLLNTLIPWSGRI